MNKTLPLLIFLSFILCCGEPQTSPEKRLTEVTLRLQWHIQAQFAGYYVALDKGFYRDEGLNVRIREGGYGKSSIKTVKHGLEEFGIKWQADIFADGDELISIANIVKENGLVLISKSKKGLKKPSQLRGKTVSVWFIGSELQLLTLLRENGVAQNQVKIIEQRWDTSQFEKGSSDAASAVVYNDLPSLFSKGYGKEDINIIDYADYGLGFPGQSVFTSRDYYRENPRICGSLVRATLRGWRYTLENINEAVAILKKHDRHDILDSKFQKAQLQALKKLINLERYKLGYHYPEKMNRIGEHYKKHGIIKKNKEIEKMYTNRFIEK